MLKSNVKVKIELAENFKTEELRKLMAAAEVMETVFNSEEFEELVLQYAWEEKYTTGFLWWKKSFAVKGEGFYLYPDARSVLYVIRGVDAGIQVTLYSSRSNVVGYTYPTTPMQWINKKFFSKFDKYDVAGNLAHEWCHKLGFEHSFKNTVFRKHSVPYAIGRMVEEIGRRLGA